jgi:hypothetical protein
VEPASWVIVGTTGANFVSYGEIVRVSVARQEERKTGVTVYTRRRQATHVFAENHYSDIIFARMCAQAPRRWGGHSPLNRAVDESHGRNASRAVG